jgi:short-subunit dehydrogenase
MTLPQPVLIIGATSDIARAIARAYAKIGRPLILAARSPDMLTRVVDDLTLRGAASVTVIFFDILDQPAHQTALAALGTAPATIICVVGYLGDQQAAEHDSAAAELIMRTNYLAPALLLDAAADRLLRAGGGTIIGISSVAGDRGRASNYLYGSAKAGFSAYLSGLRNRLARSAVHVVTIKPGFVDTRMTEGMKLPPLLTAQPEEIAAAVLAAEQKRRDVVYVRWIWRFIMIVISAIPERLFKRMRL